MSFSGLFGVRWGRDAADRRSFAPSLLLCLVVVSMLAVGRPATAQEQTITLNLKDADINAVIATVAEITGRNFIVDPRVKGKVTVISTKPLTPDEVYEVFLAVLNVHGFATIPGPSATKVVPEVNAKQDYIPTVRRDLPGMGDQYITRVIEVKNVSSAQLVPILRPLLPQQGHLAAYPPTNALIASGGAANIERLVDIVRRIDQSSDTEIELIPLRHASAEEVVRILTSLEQEAAPGQAPAERPKIIADVRTNSVLLSGEPSTRLRLKAIIAHLDTPLEASGNTRVIYLRYANAKDLATVLSAVSASLGADPGKAPPQAAAGKINIQADENTNALIINAPPDVMRDLESVVRKLDVRRAQVMVKAVIAEVSTEKATELGINWAYNGSADNAPVGVVNFPGSNTGGITSLLTSPPNFASVVGNGLTLAVGDTRGDDFRIGALLRALSGDADTNILSTPTLVTLDNEEAEIVVGQNVPFVTGSYSSTGGGTTPTNPFQTIQRQDVGLTLAIKPQINEGNAVKLDVTQEVSSLASATTGAADIITNKRSLKTSVLVEDGQVVVLGGLIDDNLRESVQKVPGLGDIPVLGWLFSYKTTSKVKRDLMIFLHPVILRTKEQLDYVSGEKYSFLRAQQLSLRERGIALMPDRDSPLLPEKEQFLELPPPYIESNSLEGKLAAPDMSNGLEQ